MNRNLTTLVLAMALIIPANGAIPDSWQYYARPVEFGWVDIEGTALGFRGADEYVVEVPLGFVFPFFGTDYDRVFVSSNGLLLFEGTTVADHANAVLPSPELPNALVACYWTDLYFPPEGEVFCQTLGDTPARRFVVQWDRAARFGLGGAVIFQAVLEEGSGRIRLNYLDTDFGDPLVDAGADAVCGLEDPFGTAGLTHSWRRPGLASRSSLEFYPAPPACPAIAAAGWGQPGEAKRALPGDVAAPLWVELRNDGPLAAGELRLTLAAESGASVTQTTCLIPELWPGAAAPAVFRASIPADCPCGAAPVFHLQLEFTDSAGRTWQTAETFELNLGQPNFTKVFLDDLEHGPGQWSSALPTGSQGWRLADGPWSGAGQAWFAPGEDGRQEAVLMAPAAGLPPLTVPAGGQLLFNHWWDLEKDYDGAVLELQIEGSGRWLDLGPYLATGGYNGSIAADYDNPLVPPETPHGTTRPAWTHYSDGPAPRTVVADLGRFAGQPVRWRFRLGSDVSTASAGWYVDDVVVWGEVRDCALVRPGDVDSDLDVDGGDLLAVLLGLGGTVAPGEWPYARPAWADLDGDGTVGAPDLALLAAHLAGSVTLGRSPDGIQGGASWGRVRP